jgi:hypothetical protein
MSEPHITAAPLWKNPVGGAMVLMAGTGVAFPDSRTTGIG